MRRFKKRSVVEMGDTHATPSGEQSRTIKVSETPFEERVSFVREKQLLLKVCGMKAPENIKGLIELSPDFIGFIFYEKSPRFSKILDRDLLSNIPKSIRKVGVFVNESIESIIKLADRFGVDYVQLHGDEDLDFATTLREKGIKIIKAFPVVDSLPIMVSKYQDVADYFLFDNATNNYGGSGKHFDWNALKNYNLKIPFLLSGGIDLPDLEKIKDMELPHLAGIDVNSKFESKPGVKDLSKIKELKAVL